MKIHVGSNMKPGRCVMAVPQEVRKFDFDADYPKFTSMTEAAKWIRENTPHAKASALRIGKIVNRPRYAYGYGWRDINLVSP